MEPDEGRIPCRRGCWLHGRNLGAPNESRRRNGQGDTRAVFDRVAEAEGRQLAGVVRHGINSALAGGWRTEPERRTQNAERGIADGHFSYWARASLNRSAIVRTRLSGETTRAKGPKLRIQLSSARSRHTSRVIAMPPASASRTRCEGCQVRARTYSA